MLRLQRAARNPGRNHGRLLPRVQPEGGATAGAAPQTSAAHTPALQLGLRRPHTGRAQNARVLANGNVDTAAML
eukprot:9600422-Lingulodinium_polyedra.AAC.1